MSVNLHSVLVQAAAKRLLWLAQAFTVAGMLLCGAHALAAEPPSEPFLRLEAGMHVNLTRAVAVDAAGRWAVTASDDKTARIWSLPDGAAGPILRVPIDESVQGAGIAEGRLQAVVITPDGSTVAVAGRSGAAWSGRQWVYVFDRASGQLTRRMDVGSALPVVTLALSPDGKLLAVGLGDNGGLKTLDFASGRLLHHDADFQGSVYALDFRADGRVLAAGALDGVLRVYNVSEGRLERAAVARPQGAKLISQARWSPDGQLLALGLEDSPQVLVLDGSTMQVVARPTPAEDGVSAFSSLAWSPDGSELWGGGTHRAGGQWLLRVWPRSNFTQFADRPVAAASVLALATLPGQRLLYVSGEPAWGIVDGAAQAQGRWQSPLASFNSMARQFRVSADGSRVQYWYGFRGELHEFNLGTRVIQPAAVGTPEGTGAAALREPHLAGPGLQVDNWENRRLPTLNGRPLPLGELEVSRSLAVSPDGQRFALGTDEQLWMFGADGKVQWQRRMPSLVWAVQLTADGKLLLSAGQDGVIRWHRAQDGAELLAFYPHADRKRWVMWTPSGYFDAAAGAEELLGWHINRGAQQAADFHPMSTLRERFRRADVVDLMLSTQDEARALAQANVAAGRPAAAAPVLAQALPPVLEIVGAPVVTAAADGQGGEARLLVRARASAQAPVTGLRARADGRPAQVDTLGAARPVKGDPGALAQERDVRVSFSGRPEQLQLFAENQHGLSAVAAVQIPWPEPSPATVAGAAVPVAAAAPAVAGTGGTSTMPGLGTMAPMAGAAGAAGAAVAAKAAQTAIATSALAVAPLALPTLVAPPLALAAAVAQVAAPAATAAPAPVLRSPRLYVLAIGVGKFTAPEMPPLNLPAKDASDFVAAMQAQQGRLYRSVDVRLLTEERATRAAIVDAMKWLEREVTQHDVGMLFVAGHGMNHPTLGYAFIPHDYSDRNARDTTVTHKQFKTTTENLAGKALFFIDTCHSGNVLGKSKKTFSNPDVSAVINDLASEETGVVVFSASTGRQEALENPAWGNGAFTKSLVEGLNGKADERSSGRITYRMLDYYITDRVKALTNGVQSAVTVAPTGVPDFPLALVGP